MIYCISDIHGCHDEFLELLEKINFSEDDTLYVLGDIVDRGRKIFECVEYVRNSKNMVYLRGNHEQMMVEFYRENQLRWDRNGGAETREQAIEYYKTQDKIDELLDYFSQLPLYIKLENINGNNFFLSHAGLNMAKTLEEQELKDFVWIREDFYGHKAMEETICIFGHTPTFYIEADKKKGFIWKDEENKDKINIDCGCVYGGSLCALCLDDLSVAYVKSTYEDK